MHTYDPRNVVVSFAGVSIPYGYGKDTFIKVSRNQDSFTLAKGVSGEGCRAKSNDRSGTVELTLLADSQANDVIAAIAAADELTATGVGPMYIKEVNGTMLVLSANAWVKKQPDIERGKEVAEVTWMFELDDMKVFAGGLLT